jgi:trans-aconitate methyltransferase
MTEKRRAAQWTPENAARFQDEGVVGAYHLRLPYPPDALDMLLNLVPAGAPPAALDVGTGTGEIARFLASHLTRVHALDQSSAMLARARTLPDGDSPRLRWIQGRAEDVELDPPYGLITAGESLHWMDWDVVLPRFASVLAPDGFLAIVYRNEVDLPWQDALDDIIQTSSTMKTYGKFNLIAELKRRGLYEPVGRYEVTRRQRQSVDDYVESFHSRSSLSRTHIGPEAAEAFDAAVRELVEPFAENGMLALRTAARVDWGRCL